MQAMTGAQKGFTFSPPHVIRHRAEQLEMDETKKLQLVPSSLSFLGDLFDEVYTMLQPSIQDYEARQALITFVDKIVKLKIHGSSVSSSGPSVRAFGSFTMDLFTAESDLDLSVSLGHTGNAFPRENKIQVLKKLVKGLYGLQGGGKIRAVQPVLRAIVPIVKFVDSRSGIECDISIENKDGVYKSELIHIFSSIDKRFQKLCYLMKAWAKAHNINSSKDGTLNSLSIILLVAFHLQTRATPILPPFSVFLEAGGGLPEVEKRVLRYKQFGSSNRETVPELFISLMCKLLSVKSLWKEGLCASTYEGSWISKMFNNNCMNVEDFADRSQNAARSVGMRECEIIYECIRETLSLLQKRLTSLSQISDLKAFLFEPHSESNITSGQSPKTRTHQNLGKRRMPFEDIVGQKRMRNLKDKESEESFHKFRQMQFGVEGSNPSVAESIVRTVPPVPRYEVPPIPGKVQSQDQEWRERHQSQEQAWGARHRQWQDPLQGARFGQSPDIPLGVRYGQWQDPGYGPRYSQGHDQGYGRRYSQGYDPGFAPRYSQGDSPITGRPNLSRNSAAFQSQTVLHGSSQSHIIDQMRIGSLLSHLDHLESHRGKPNANIVGSSQSNWNLYNQGHGNIQGRGRY